MCQRPRVGRPEYPEPLGSLRGRPDRAWREDLLGRGPPSHQQRSVPGTAAPWGGGQPAETPHAPPPKPSQGPPRMQPGPPLAAARALPASRAAALRTSSSVRCRCGKGAGLTGRAPRAPSGEGGDAHAAPRGGGPGTSTSGGGARRPRPMVRPPSHNAPRAAARRSRPGGGGASAPRARSTPPYLPPLPASPRGHPRGWRHVRPDGARARKPRLFPARAQEGRPGREQERQQPHCQPTFAALRRRAVQPSPGACA